MTKEKIQGEVLIIKKDHDRPARQLPRISAHDLAQATQPLFISLKFGTYYANNNWKKST